MNQTTPIDLSQVETMLGTLDPFSARNLPIDMNTIKTNRETLAGHAPGNEIVCRLKEVELVTKNT